MKRSIASTLLVLVCVLICGVVLYADPGTDPATTDSTYVVPPPGYVGIWPPPDGLISTTGTDPSDTCNGAGEPWTDPGQ